MPTAKSGPKSSAPELPLRLGSTNSVIGLTVKILGLGLAAALAIGATPVLLASGSWLLLGGLWLATIALFVIYAGKRLIPAKYLAPGTVFLAVFVIVPILYTVQISTTNQADGTRGSKAETIQTIERNSVLQGPESRNFNLSIAVPGSTANSDGPFTLFLVDQKNGEALRADANGTEPAPQAQIQDGFVRSAPGFAFLDPRQVAQAGKALAAAEFPSGRESIHLIGLSFAFEGSQQYRYDQASDSMRNSATGELYPVREINGKDYFVRADGSPAFDQSWQKYVGASNYLKLFTDSSLRDAFAGTFLWTVVFAVVSVASTFLLGLLLALTLNERRMRGLRYYRAAMLIPYAIPTFISFLVWASFYNKDFGLINGFLGGAQIDWLGDPTLAKVAILLTNLWVGFPYMFLICLGALQSLPGDVDEAAKIDGASAFQSFTRVKFPLVMVAVAPLLVASCAFNFNNFAIIQLLTGGAPFPSDGAQIGSTDIMISATYRVAFGSSGADFGFAAAISVLLFVVTAVLASIQFKFTKALEDVR